MRILGIDPGTGRTGFGVLTKDGTRTTPVEFGVLTTAVGAEPEQRLADLATQLRAVVTRTTPAVLAIEKLFFAKNVTTGMRVAEARGVVLLVAAEAGLEVHEYTPLQVKQSVTGYGQADKAQVTTMVTKLLGLPKPPTPDDAADALAVALCHAGWRQT